MTEIEKASSHSKTVTRPLQEVGQPGLVTSAQFIEDIKKNDLSMKNRFKTYDNMLLDDAVSNSIDITNVLVVSALNRGKFVPKKGSSISEAAADFLNYNIRNMRYGTWMEAMNTAATDLQNGFAIENIVVKRATHGKYKGAYTLDKLSPRAANRVYGWVWNKNNTELKGYIQMPNLRKDREPKLSGYSGYADSSLLNGGIYANHSKYPFIHAQNILHFRHNPKFDNPQGQSPLNSCYAAFIEKKMIEHYEMVGVSKDFGGIAILRVPSKLIEEAELDPTGTAAKEYKQLQEDIIRLQQGKSGHILLTSDVDETTSKYLYDFELRGITGQGTQYSTEELINQRRRAIYNVFGTSFLLLGQNGHGSNALAGSQMTTHDYFTQRCIDWKVDVLNHQLAPRLLAVNDAYLDHEDMPTFEPEDPSKPDLETISKFIQRSDSTNSLNDNARRQLLESAGLDTSDYEAFLKTRKDLVSQSKAGQSQGTGGTGDTQSGGSTSATNSENKSLNLFVDSESEHEIVAIDVNTGKEHYITR